VGGGVAEARVEELAKATLVDGLPRVFEADMRGRPGDTRDGVCGGSMTVWIVRLEPTASLPALRVLTQFLQAGCKVALSLRFQADEPIVVFPLDKAMTDSSPEQFTEIIQPSPRLLIVGAGHIGRSLAYLVDRLGFALTVQDGRPEWLVSEAFPAGCACEFSLDEAAGALRQWEGGRFIALVTRGFPQDVEALKVLSEVPADYFGILGSKARVATVFAAAREAGLPIPASPVLHAPIGIEIGAETPDEIAVSIAAEIIRVWRRGCGSTMRLVS